MMMDEAAINTSNLSVSDTVGYSNPFKSGARPKFVFGNWKMHGNQVEAIKLAGAIADGITQTKNNWKSKLVTAIFPPFPAWEWLRRI